MKILLQSFSFSAENEFYNLGLLFLRAAVATRPDLADQVSVRVIQSDLFDDADKVFREIAEEKPDMLGFSPFIWSLDLTRDLIRRCGQLSPRPVILCGGSALCGWEAGFMAETPGTDIVVKGQGEATFVALADHYLNHARPWQALDRIRGIVFRTAQGTIRDTGDRQGNIPLDGLPSPYLNGDYRPGNRLMLETSRYCPFRCEFCSWSKQPGRKRDNAFSLDYIRRELEWGVANQVRNNAFFDAALNYDTGRFTRFLRLLDDLPVNDAPGFNSHYFFFIKTESLNRRQIEAIRSIRKACTLFLGMDHLSPAMSRSGGDPAGLAAAGELINTLTANPNVRVMAGMIIGLPGDTPRYAAQVIETLSRMPRLHLVVSLLCVNPGTVLHTRARELGLNSARTGVPFLRESRDFPKESIDALLERIQHHIPEGRVELNTTLAPLGRIRNPEVIPARVRETLSPETRVRVGVAGIDNGHVRASGYYPPELSPGRLPDQPN